MVHDAPQWRIDGLCDGLVATVVWMHAEMPMHTAKKQPSTPAMRRQQISEKKALFCKRERIQHELDGADSIECARLKRLLWGGGFCGYGRVHGKIEPDREIPLLP